MARFNDPIYGKKDDDFSFADACRNKVNRFNNLHNENKKQLAESIYCIMKGKIGDLAETGACEYILIEKPLTEEKTNKVINFIYGTNEEPKQKNKKTETEVVYDSNINSPVDLLLNWDLIIGNINDSIAKLDTSTYSCSTAKGILGIQGLSFDELEQAIFFQDVKEIVFEEFRSNDGLKCETMYCEDNIRNCKIRISWM